MRAPTLLRRAAPLALGLAALAGACDQYPVTPRYRLAVEPDTLAFTARQGGLPPIVSYLTVSGTGLIEWTATSDAPWLALSSSSGNVPHVVTVSPDNAGLTRGTYRGSIEFASAGARNTPVQIAVRLDIADKSPLAGRWLGAWDVVILSFDVRDSSGVYVGAGIFTVPATPFTALGTRTDDYVTLNLQPPTGAPITLHAFFFNDHTLRGALTGPGFPGDSVVLFRQ
ncbi:MAG: hypothetical protein A2083_10045 [Gemmatimonadetes bacterium GWC2_71_9]|nr:MAG: hypothetical protein A2083_10045 [Gemmatimonadetes bacterium GWC2_71_9]